MLPRRRDRARRAELEAARAADDLRARMGAEAVREGDELRLVEGADEVRGREDRPLHGRRIARVGAKIAAADLVGRKERESAGEVEHEVAARDGAVARRAESKPGPGRGGALREIGDAQLEGAEVPLGASDRALEHRKL